MVNLLKDEFFSLIDLTSLNANDTQDTIQVLCEKAIENQHAAVCIFPQFIKEAVHILKNTSVNVATVVNFPRGDDSLTSVLHSIEQALNQGADEIDVVFPYQKYMNADDLYAKKFVKACKKVCGTQILKVILETGVLQEQEMIMAAARDMILAGADFLKTSTGKVPIGATPEAAEIILKVIHRENPKVGIKISGGIRTQEQIREYLNKAEQVMGVDWITPKHFRFGMSQLI